MSIQQFIASPLDDTFTRQWKGSSSVQVMNPNQRWLKTNCSQAKHFSEIKIKIHRYSLKNVDHLSQLQCIDNPSDGDIKNQYLRPITMTS